MATMADVARSAGVSVATVSHVLNDTRPVLPGTRQAVLTAIEELGYTPNTLARSLVTSRSRSIGLAVRAKKVHFSCEGRKQSTAQVHDMPLTWQILVG